MEEKKNKITKENKVKETFNETKKRKPYVRKNVKKENEVKEENLEKTTKTRQHKPRTENKIEKNNNKNKNVEKKSNSIFKPSKLKIIPLGGLHEVGKNITVFEYENEMIIVDCGISFPEDDMLGIDLVIPDVTYVEKNQEKLKGMIITHGHEDHIGSIPYFLKKVNTPIYATKLTCGLITNKLEEHKLVNSTKLIEVNQGQTITLGKFRIEFIPFLISEIRQSPGKYSAFDGFD